MKKLDIMCNVELDVPALATYLASQVNRPKDLVYTMTQPMMLSGLYWGAYIIM